MIGFHVQPSSFLSNYPVLRLPFPVFGRREAHHFRESTRKVSRLFKTKLSRYLIQFQASQYNILASLLDLQSDKITDRRHACFLLKQHGKMRRGILEISRQLIQGKVSLDMLIHIMDYPRSKRILLMVRQIYITILFQI